MNSLLIATATAAVAFSDFPGALSNRSTVEAAIDRGLIVELVVRCGSHAGMLTYSKVEKRFCDPALRCHARLADARRATCAGK